MTLQLFFRAIVFLLIFLIFIICMKSTKKKPYSQSKTCNFFWNNMLTFHERKAIQNRNEGFLIMHLPCMSQTYLPSYLGIHIKVPFFLFLVGLVCFFMIFFCLFILLIVYFAVKSSHESHG